MTIRRWTILTISALASLIIALIFTVNIIIDPYGEFRLIEGNYNKLKFKNLKSSALKVASKLYDGQYTLVFGSSRTMLVSEEILGEPVLNFSTSIYVNPGDILALLKTFDEKQIKNIKQIYYLIDINSFHYESSAPELASRAALFMESFRNIGPDKIEDAWKCVVGNLGPESDKPNYIDEFGVLHKKDESYKDNVVVFNSHFVSNYYLDKLAEINSFCKSNRIKVTYFTVPWHENLTPKSQTKLKEVFKSVASACDKYYDLFNTQEIKHDKNLFSDPTHLNLKGLKKLFNSTYWTKIKYSEEKTDDLPNFRTMNKSDFFNYLQKHPELINIDFIDQLHKLGCDNLVLAFYDKPQVANGLITNCFFLNKKSLLKTILSSGRNFNSNQYIVNDALYYAIKSGTPDTVRDAILLGANVNNLIVGTTPLQMATLFTKNNNILTLLVDSGANINYICEDKLKLQFFGHSVFTLTFAKNSPNQLNYLIKQYPNHPLAKHAKLLRELENNPNNATAFEECSALQKKYYKIKGGMADHYFLSNPSKCYLKLNNNQNFLVVFGNSYPISSEDAALFMQISIKNNVNDIITKACNQLYPYGSLDPKQEKEIRTYLKGRFTQLIIFLKRNNLIKKIG